MRSFFETKREFLEEVCRDLDVPLLHAKTLLRNAYKYGMIPPWEADGIPKKLKKYCDGEFEYKLPIVVEKSFSNYDYSNKFLFKLSDDSFIESVLMPETKRITLCVSSQVGCGQACSFCHTGRIGLKRNLSADEIVGQIVAANRWIDGNSDWLKNNRLPKFLRITNVVFMGMGEPLDNLDAVLDAIGILSDPCGPSIGPRRISVSTAGNLPGIEHLRNEFSKVRIAISVQSADDFVRSKLMPINKKWPIELIMKRLRELPLNNKEHILIQYSLIKGINDSKEDALRLVKLLEGVKVKVNLIPFNSVEAARFVSPESEVIEEFRDVIHKSGIRVMIRYSKGQDIAAACGQLAAKR